MGKMRVIEKVAVMRRGSDGEVMVIEKLGVVLGELAAKELLVMIDNEGWVIEEVVGIIEVAVIIEEMVVIKE